MATYIGNNLSDGLLKTKRAEYVYTASGDAVFSGADDNSKTLSVPSRAEVLVFHDGSLIPSTDYTVTTDTITLNTAVVGEVVIITELQSSLIDSFTRSEAIDEINSAVQNISIDDLTDVDTSTTAPTTGQSIIWDGSNFVPGDSFSQADFDTAFAAKDTDGLTEGSTNLYYTDARADARIALNVGANLDLTNQTTDDLAEGATNRYFTNTRARAALNNGTGLDYSAATGVFALANTAVTAGSYGSASAIPVLTIDAQGRITAASTTAVAGVSNFTYDALNEQLTITTADGGSHSVDISSLASESLVSSTVAAIVDSAPATLDTLNELAAALGDDPNFATTISNQIGTKLSTADFDSSFDTRLATKTTDDVSEGSTNLYYTTIRANTDFDTHLATKTTTNLAEGTNLYYTDARVQSVINSNTAGFITGYTVTQSDVTQHQAALTITESQISDLTHFDGDYNSLTNAPVTYQPEVPGSAGDGILGTYPSDVSGWSPDEVATDGVHYAMGFASETVDADTRGKVYVHNVSTGALVQTLENPDTYVGTLSNYDGFGQAIDISGDYIIIGAPKDDTSTYGDHGRAYVFQISTGNLIYSVDNPNPNTYSSQYVATNPDPANHSGDYFGWNVAITDTYFVVAAPGEEATTTYHTGRVYVYDLATGTLQHTITPTTLQGAFAGAGTEQYGERALAAYGDYAIVGAYQYNSSTGQAYLIDLSTGSVTRTINNPNTSTGSGDRFGMAVDISANHYVVGAPQTDTATNSTHGKAYVFDLATGNLVYTLTNPYTYHPEASWAQNFYGSSVFVGDDYITIGARGISDPTTTYNGYFEGAILIYDLATGTQQHNILGDPNFEAGNLIDCKGDIFVIAGKINPANSTSVTKVYDISTIGVVQNSQPESNTVSGTLVADGLEVAGITYPSTDGTSGQAITTDGNGTLSFTSITYYNSGDFDTDFSGKSIGDLSNVDITTTAPTNGQTIVWDGTEFVPGDSFSQADFDTAFTAKDTDDLSEGSTNLYYTDARVNNYLTTNNWADQSYVTTAIANLVDSAPTTLDTLNELAAALGDDPNFATTISNQIGTKLNTADFTTTADTWLTTKDTDDLAEGTTNQYYTDARVQNVVTTAYVEGLAIDATSVAWTNEHATDIVADNVHDAIDQLNAIKANISDIASNVILYPTTAAADVTGYVRMVTDTNDSDYNSTAVDVSTGAIDSTTFLISSLVSDAGVIVGNPGVINLSVLGNIRKVSGNANARFYFEVYKRASDGTETLMSTSTTTDEVTSTTYEQFGASALLNDGIFVETDRIVYKFYGVKVGTNTDPVYEFQFGGGNPIRALLPVPFQAVPTNVDSSNLVIDTTNFDGNLASSQAVLQSALDIIDDLEIGSGAATTIGTTAPTSPVEGQLWYSTTDAELYIYDGAAWFGAGDGVGDFFAEQDTDALAEGSTNLYYTDARARSAISVGGDLSYDPNTGVISFSATAAPVISVNGQTGSVVLGTDDITEGTTNLYYTSARGDANFATNFAAEDTDGLSEGITNLYYTDARVQGVINTNTAGYATETYVDTAVANLVDAAPTTLDTLNELAAALGDDPNFATTISTNIGTKWTQDNTKITNWDTAYGWGDHSAAGYLTAIDISAESIGDLSDVDITTAAPTDGQVLKWDNANSKFVPGDAASSIANLTDVDLTGLTNNSVLKYDATASEWIVGTNSTAQATANVIVPFAFAFVDTINSGSGTNISWGNWNSSNYTMDFTFGTAQPNTNYAIITDSETFDDYFVGISNKTTTGFRAEFYDDATSRTPSGFSPFSFVVYAETPTETIYADSYSSIGDLPDVDLSTAPTDGQVLKWDNANSKFVPANDNAGTTINSIDDIGDVDTTTTAPTNGQALVWDGTNWTPGTVATSGGASVTVSDTAPSSPSEGDMWFDSTNLVMFVYYDSSWVEPTSIADNHVVQVSETAPSTASENSLWWNSNDGNLYVYYNDGDSTQWVQANATDVNVSVSDLSNVSSTAPTDGQALVWNATNNEWEPGTVASSGGGVSAGDFTHFHSTFQTITSTQATNNASGTLDLTFAELDGAVHYQVYINRTLLRPTEASVSGTTVTIAQGILATDDEIEVVGLSV